MAPRRVVCRHQQQQQSGRSVAAPPPPPPHDARVSHAAAASSSTCPAADTHAASAVDGGRSDGERCGGQNCAVALVSDRPEGQKKGTGAERAPIDDPIRGRAAVALRSRSRDRTAAKKGRVQFVERPEGVIQDLRDYRRRQKEWGAVRHEASGPVKGFGKKSSVGEEEESGVIGGGPYKDREEGEWKPSVIDFFIALI